MILASLPALFTLLGFSWARKAAEAFALAGMIIGILFVLRNGVSLVAIPAVGYFVVYAFLSHDRLKAGEAKSRPSAPPAPEHPLAWLKENVEAIAVAFIMALVIRCFCVEVFKIPSSSMEPTLLGDTVGRGGDRIMVTKLTYGLQDVARFEPVVFKFPLNPMKNFIKRVVGLPGEKFMIFNGNVYTIPDDTQDRRYKIRRKPLHSQRSIWIPAWRRDGIPLLQNLDAFEGSFTPSAGTTSNLRDGVLSGGGSGKVSWTADPINDGHLGDSHATPVNDILFEADLRLQAGTGGFWVRIDHDLGPFVLNLSPGGGSTLQAGGQNHPLKTAAFPAGKTVHLEFMVFDGQVVVLFDGRIQAEIAFQETFDQVQNATEKQGLRFGSEVAFALSDLRVGQDIHYKPKGDAWGHQLTAASPLIIPPGKYFMLGDNVNNSHDGRAWRKYTIRLRSGEVIEYESQAAKNFEAKIAWAKRTGRQEPTHLIEADKDGHERAIYEEQIKEGPGSGDNFPFVDGSYIIGRAFAVCWPFSRSLRLIR